MYIHSELRNLGSIPYTGNSCEASLGGENISAHI